MDLLGYLTIKTPGLDDRLPGYVDRAIGLLKEENQLMVRHPNSVLYNRYHRFSSSFTEFYRVLPSFTEFYRVLPSFT